MSLKAAYSRLDLVVHVRYYRATIRPHSEIV